MYKLILGCGIAVGLAGCAAHELRNDQERIRCTLLDLYTNQIMDNLIRASNGLPIVQIDYTNATAQVTVKESAGINGDSAVTHSGALTAAVVTSFAGARMVLSTLSGTGGIDHTNQVSVTAAPVTASDDVYESYAQFLALPGSLQSADSPPEPGGAHLCKRCGDRYYWVPIEFQKEFLWLALKTTAQRQSAVTLLDPFYTVNIVEVVSQVRVPKQDGLFKVVVKIDKWLPNDDGYVDFNADSKGGASSSKAKDGTTPGTDTKEKGTPVGEIKAPTAAKGLPRPRFGIPADAEDLTPGKLVVAQAQPEKDKTGDQKPSLPSGVFDVRKYVPPAGPVPLTTNLVVIYFDTMNSVGSLPNPETLAQNVPVPIKLWLRHHRPLVPTANDPLRRIEFQLQQIQFNQLRVGGAL